MKGLTTNEAFRASNTSCFFLRLAFDLLRRLTFPVVHLDFQREVRQTFPWVLIMLKTIKNECTTVNHFGQHNFASAYFFPAWLSLSYNHNIHTSDRKYGIFEGRDPQNWGARRTGGRAGTARSVVSSACEVCKNKALFGVFRSSKSSAFESKVCTIACRLLVRSCWCNFFDNPAHSYF